MKKAILIVLALALTLISTNIYAQDKCEEQKKLQCKTLQIMKTAIDSALLELSLTGKIIINGKDFTEENETMDESNLLGASTAFSMSLKTFECVKND